MKAVLFDLDDTLYPEMEFVRSGFRAVARFLSRRHKLDEDLLLLQMVDIFEKQGRGNVFDQLLQSMGLLSEEMVRLLVWLYRSHIPDIRLYSDALPAITQLKNQGVRLGIVTDGMASVQRNKIKALGLENLFDSIICTDELGKECWKPSAVAFKVALELWGIMPPESLYVGNDPLKDFPGPNSIGMTAVQITRIRDKSVSGTLPEDANPSVVIRSLGEVIKILGGKRNER